MQEELRQVQEEPRQMQEEPRQVPEEPRQVQEESRQVQEEPQQALKETQPVPEEAQQVPQEVQQVHEETQAEQLEPQPEQVESQQEQVETQEEQAKAQQEQAKEQQDQAEAQPEQAELHLRLMEPHQDPKEPMQEQKKQQQKVVKIIQTDEWIDLDDDSNDSSNQKKSLFSTYSNLCNRLMSNASSVSWCSSSGAGTGAKLRVGGSRQSKSPASNFSENEVPDPDVKCKTSVPTVRASESSPSKLPEDNCSDSAVPDPNTKCTRSDPTLGEPSLTDVPNISAVPSVIDVPVEKSVDSAESIAETVPSVIVTPTIISNARALISVQNVGYRLRSTPTQHVAYYCLASGCTFLFSNELEGLENHFAREHPLTRWNGTCSNCPEQEQRQQQELSISEELRHLVQHHMDMDTAPVLSAVPPPAAAPAPAPEPEPEPEPIFPKLRVRRFTGDRLVEAEEEATAAMTAEQLQQTEGEPDFGLVNSNTMLRGLLANPSRPPIMQQPNSAANPTAVQSATVVNHPSELNLSIKKVFSLVDRSLIPLTIGTSDFVLTQSVPQNFDGQIPAEINISLQPHASVPLTHPEPAQPAVTATPINQRSYLIADRFRCMAANCNYCAHTVMCIREHMKFHRFSFGNKDYLHCAYCTHVAHDVDDYVHHGVIEHGLAHRSELVEPSNEHNSTSQLIRDKLNQRTASRISMPGILQNSETDPQRVAAGTESTATNAIGRVIEEILKHTGYRGKLEK